MEISKRDWKLFREKLPDWQEKYMGQLVQEYTTLLNTESQASEKFWKLEKRINLDKRKKGVIMSPRKSDAIFDIVELFRDGAITMDDLSDFSQRLKR